jgi:seryl-tRNA synthetase
MRDNAKDKYECAVKAHVQYITENAIKAGTTNGTKVKDELAKLGEVEDKLYDSILSLRKKSEHIIVYGHTCRAHTQEVVQSLHQILVIRTGDDKPSKSELKSLSEQFNAMKRKIMTTIESD